MKGKRTVSKKNSKNLLIGLLVIVIIVAVVLGVVLSKKNKNNNNKSVENRGGNKTVRFNKNKVKIEPDGLTITEVATRLRSLFIKSLPPDTPVPFIEQLKEEISRTTIKGIILNEVIQNTPGLSEKDIKEINLTYSCLLKSKNMDEFKNCSPN